MRVLWLTNIPVGVKARSGSGTWLDETAGDLANSGEVELAVVSCGRIASHQESGGIQQWTIPPPKTAFRDGRLDNTFVRAFGQLVEAFAPNVINVWGTEGGLGLLTAREVVSGPAVLTLQGITYRIAACYEGGLTKSEILATRGVWQIIRGVSVPKSLAKLRRWESCEREILAGHRWVVCQTPWQEAQAQSNGTGVAVFRVDLPVRKPFAQVEPWKLHPGGMDLFCLASYATPFKGLHVAVRALALLKHRFPSVKLRIAGIQPGRGFRQDGYLRWLASEIGRLELGDNVCWLGPLTAEQIADELSKASVMVLPTFIESYCVSLAEAMVVGTPTVVSFTGGTAHLGRDEESCLFFPPGDDAMCAYQVSRVLTESDLAQRLSSQARRIAAARHAPEAILQQNLQIYRRVCAANTS